MPLVSPARRRLVSGLAALPWVVVLFQFLAVLPRYDKLFRESGVPVGGITAVLLNVSAWVGRNVAVAFVLTFALMAVSVFTAHTVQLVEFPRGRRAAILLVVFGVPTLVFGLVVFHTHRTLVGGN